MSKQYTKYYQKCDFCHQEFEVSKDGMDYISLPGWCIDSDGYKLPRYVKGNICDECINKLRKKLAEFVDIKDIAYGDVSIHWLDDKEETMDEE